MNQQDIQRVENCTSPQEVCDVLCTIDPQTLFALAGRLGIQVQDGASVREVAEAIARQPKAGIVQEMQAM